MMKDDQARRNYVNQYLSNIQNVDEILQKITKSRLAIEKEHLKIGELREELRSLK